MSSPALSVIVLSYNRPAYLRVALESALAQSLANIEIVIADDCSTDLAVHELLLEYARRDPRISYERPEKNVGVVTNLLRAVARTRAPYVTILCDDDLFEPEYAARLLAPFESDPSLCVTFCDASVIDAEGQFDASETATFARRWKRAGLGSSRLQPFVDAALGARSLQPAMGAIFRKDAVPWHDFPPEAGAAWDLWLAYLAARDGGAAAYVAERLLRYRVHPNALTQRRDVGWHRGQVYIYERLFADERLAGLRTAFGARLARYHCETGMALLRRGERLSARGEFRESTRIRPSGKATIGRVLCSLPGPPVGSLFAAYDALRARLLRAWRRARAAAGKRSRNSFSLN